MSMEIKKDMTGRKFVVKLYKTRQKEYIKDFEELTIAISHYFCIEPYHREHESKCPFCQGEV